MRKIDLLLKEMAYQQEKLNRMKDDLNLINGRIAKIEIFMSQMIYVRNQKN